VSRGGWKELLALGAILLMLFTQAQTAAAQSNSADRLGQARGFFALPVELDIDRGAANGDASILRMMPLYTFPVFDTWKLVNLTIFSLADAPGGLPEFPGDTSAGQTAGISDLLHASFVTPNRSGDFIWGAGVILAIPTATDDSLGSDKWDAGPAFRLTYRKSPWNLGCQPAVDTRRHPASVAWRLVLCFRSVDYRELGQPRRKMAGARRRGHRPRIQSQEISVGLVGPGLLQRHQARICARLGCSIRGHCCDSIW
jgi:hypothetical protein